MPRKTQQQAPRPGNAVFLALWDQMGAVPLWTPSDWTLDPVVFWEAANRVMENGGQLVMRHGSGGQALGISIWSGDNRPPAQYFHEEEQLTEWCAKVMQSVPPRKKVVVEE